MYLASEPSLEWEGTAAESMTLVKCSSCVLVVEQARYSGVMAKRHPKIRQAKRKTAALGFRSVNVKFSPEARFFLSVSYAKKITLSATTRL
jgi:hypothetical protein